MNNKVWRCCESNNNLTSGDSCRALHINHGNQSEPSWIFGYTSTVDGYVDADKQKKYTNVRWREKPGTSTNLNYPPSKVQLINEFDTLKQTKEYLKSNGHRDRFVAIYGDFHVETQKLTIGDEGYL